MLGCIFLVFCYLFLVCFVNFFIHEFNFVSTEKSTILAPKLSFILTFIFLYIYPYTIWHNGKIENKNR